MRSCAACRSRSPRATRAVPIQIGRAFGRGRFRLGFRDLRSFNFFVHCMRCVGGGEFRYAREAWVRDADPPSPRDEFLLRRVTNS
jgi:hypothetical protein